MAKGSAKADAGSAVNRAPKEKIAFVWISIPGRVKNSIASGGLSAEGGGKEVRVNENKEVIPGLAGEAVISHRGRRSIHGG